MATPAKEDPKSAFAWAVKTGDLANVKEFVEKDKMDVNMVEEGVSKRTPLHWAADFNQGWFYYATHFDKFYSGSFAVFTI
jgi:hypothetical protein